MVVGNNIDTQLIPFQENNMDDCPEEFLEFIDKTDEYIMEYNTGDVEVVVMPDGSYKFTWDVDFKHGDLLDQKTVIPEDLEQKNIKFKELYETLDLFCEEWHSATVDEKTSKYGYWENPKAKWDWYSIGGRWEGFFNMKDGTKANSGLIKDIDFISKKQKLVNEADKRFDDAMELMGKTLNTLKPWKYFREEKYPDDNNKAMEVYNNQEAVKLFRQSVLCGFGDGPEEFLCTKEKYLDEVNNNAGVTYAFLIDGDWVERGEMEWFGMSSNEIDKDKWDEKFQEMLNSLPETERLTLVDCHI